jgi:hypothetical protein
MRIIKEDNVEVINQNFANDCTAQLSVRKTLVNQVIAKLSSIKGVAVKYDFTR